MNYIMEIKKIKLTQIKIINNINKGLKIKNNNNNNINE